VSLEPGCAVRRPCHAADAATKVELAVGDVPARPCHVEAVWSGDDDDEPMRAADHGWRGALAYCARPEHLRRTTRIALVVGLILTAINQSDVILSGDATTGTWIKCALNFLVPFCVSNLGLLSGRS
jgi:hypothetical protein